MTARFLVAGLLLLLSHACWALEVDTHAWQWRRNVTLAKPAVEQCIVLDADLYAHAAPGLRDVRLLQQGREVAYALEESYDESASTNPLSDRSQFSTVLQVPLSVSRETASSPATQLGLGTLPHSVPVERIVLVPAQEAGRTKAGEGQEIEFHLTALPSSSETPGSTAREAEVIQAVLDPASPWLLTAIGANLQSDAALTIAVTDREQRFSSVLLQMRQRSLCFQPLSPAPLVLLFGKGFARPVHYDYARHYHPVAVPVLALLGPSEPNPQYRGERPRVAALPFTRLRQTGLAVLAGFGVVLLLISMLFRR